MTYEDYFSVFLTIEDDLCEFLRVVDYSEKHRNIYSHKLVLMLLQTCPVIESYLVRVVTSGSFVQNSPIWNSPIKHKIWDTNKDGTLKSKNGKRSINGFPKFSCLANELFELDDQSVKFYHSERFQENDGCKSSIYLPFNSLETALSANSDQYIGKTNYPKGYSTPNWWTAYNKVKHSFDDEAQNRVTYSIVIEAISALFCVLCRCEPSKRSLEMNGIVKNKITRTRLFQMEL